MRLEFADPMDMAVTNTLFRKEESQESKLWRYESGDVRTVVDYVLIRKGDRRTVRNVGVLMGSAAYHSIRRKKGAFVSRIRPRKLKEAGCRQGMQEVFIHTYA